MSFVPFHVTEVFDSDHDSHWFSLILDVIDRHAPMKQWVIKNNKVPYMNTELRRAINVRNMLRRKYDRCKIPRNWSKCKNQRNIVTKLRRKSTRSISQSSVKMGKVKSPGVQ